MSNILYFSNYKIIMETENFCVFIPDMPHVDRADGGHICICIKNSEIFTLQELPLDQLLELSVITSAVGDSMLAVAKQQGIDIELINYQINGNWTHNQKNRANLHVHLYGRAVSSQKQVFGECLFFPNKKKHPEFYADNLPFSDDEILLIRQYADRLLKTKFKDVRIIVK